MRQPLNLFHILKFLILKRFKSSDICSFEKATKSCDVAVIGGGIIGTSIARRIKQSCGNLEVKLFEKECALAKHQSSHNSGVVHSGIYYKPGSLKAKFCVEGANLLQEYCTNKGILLKKVGKVILALNDNQIQGLKTLSQRGQENGIQNVHVLPSQCEIQKICSGCRGVQALWLPNVSIVDFKEVTISLAEDFRITGGQIIYNFNVSKIQPSGDCENPIILTSDDNQNVKTKYIILCGGLQSEYLTKTVDAEDFKQSKQKSITIRAEYLSLDAQYIQGTNASIYKVPNLDLPFLQAHLTPQLDGKILLGPWVVPSLTIDSYNCSDVNLGYVRNLITSPSFQNMILRNFCDCVSQTAKDICSDLRVKELQEMIPNLPYQHLKKSPVALQVQFLNHDGTFVDDFLFDLPSGSGIQSRTINLKFTPSPAATSCLSIADFVEKEFSKILCS